MQMKGHCEVNANWVPQGKLGGGIYLAGRLYVGDKKNDSLTAHALKVNRNFAININDVSGITTLYNAETLSKEQKTFRNNVLLVRSTYDYTNAGYPAHDDDANVITLLSNISGEAISKDEAASGTNIGFSVQHGYCPVIATAAGFGENYQNYAESNTDFINTYEKWLAKLMPANETGAAMHDNSSIFEDSETYIAIHTKTDNQPFRGKYIYLWGSWTNPAVSEDPEILNPMTNNASTSENFLGHYKIVDKTDGILTWEIYSEEGLSWFSSYVNGLNAFNPAEDYHPDQAHSAYTWDKTKNPYAKAVLMNDLDMTKYFWVPIGSVTKFSGEPNPQNPSANIYIDNNDHPFKGVFDGNGHVIKGIDCRFLTGVKKYGLLGSLEGGANVKNVFVDASQFISDKDSQGYYIGGIAAMMMDSAVISNSESRTTIDANTCLKTGTYVGGIVGKMEDKAEVHSSMAMPEISGAVKYVGGLVGHLGSNNNLYNSFSNPKFPDTKYTDTIRTGETVTDSIYFGGLAGINEGTIANCYSRLQGSEPIGDGKQTGKSIFGWLAGTNTGTIQYSYAPKPESGTRRYVRKTASPGNIAPTGHGTYGLTKMSEYGTATDRRRKYEFDQKDQQITLESGQTNGHVVNGVLNGLLPTLNHWVKETNGESAKYSTWSRTMASPINDDYPVLEFADFDCLSSTDNVYLEYKADLDDMIRKYNDVEGGGDILLYASTRTNAVNDGTDGNPTCNLVESSTDGDVRVYINENVGLLQATGSNINARVGVTLDNSKGTVEIGGEPYDWHMFSSALKSASMGLKYHTDETNYPGVSDYYVLNNYNNLVSNGIPHADYLQRTNMDPPKTTWFQGTVCIDSVGYFPINTPYGSWRSASSGTTGSFDFYCYGEAYYQHWINFKRDGREGLYDHWRQDPDPDNNNVHYQIQYPNERTLVQAKGYMVGINENNADLNNHTYENNPERRNMMMADGELNNGAIEYKATYTTDPEATSYDYEVRGCNLIGNPYQSYLNFDEFIDGNSGKVLGNTYFILDADQGRYVSYTKGASENPIAAPGYIHPHQGFLVKVGANQTLTFTNDMRSASGNDDSYFRGGRINYPLVNLICTDASGKCDATTIELNRPDVGGGQKMKGIRTSNALVYVHMDGVDYQTAFAPAGISSVPVRFDVLEDGVFTMRWGTLHGDFSYLHLIDNLTGADIDCLRQDAYHFESKITDYKSRFKLVFDYTGIGEQEDGGCESSTTFAFQMGSELVVNGEGFLQMFDLNGRLLLAKQMHGAQTTLGLPRVASGLYVLRLTTNNQSKTQKMIIE